MIQVGTPDKLIAHRIVDEGKFRGTSDLMIESEPGEGPQAFLVRQEANWILPQHFHQQHQFQVVLEGSGTLGRHPLIPLAVHYAAPQTAYGPITAGADGLTYFTLRALSDRGTWYLPESRAAMTKGVLREQKSTEPPADKDAGLRTMLPIRDDGLGAWVCRVNKGQAANLDQPLSSAGRFYIVASGKFSFNGQPLPPTSCAYWSPPDDLPQLVAEEDNSEMVVVQFPEQAKHHYVPPEVIAAAPMLPFKY